MNKRINKRRQGLWQGLLRRWTALRGEARLSRRQSEVARLAEAGLTNMQIATRLGISQATVKALLNAIYRKH